MMDRSAQRGADVDLSPWSSLPLRALLFGEAQGRIVVSTPDPDAVLAIATRAGVPGRRIGTVSDASTLALRIGTRTITAPLARLAESWHEAIPRIMQRSASAQDVMLQSDSVA